ncbi:hypothetical protein [Streptomyces sp. NPDC097981]|uniref:hypothetical protein n=1 Tax=Streptomyces sp. NPDC097981 TaxID=3155428 RepID=UPI003320F833
MAGLVYFRRVFEDSTVVRYAFGDDPDAFTRRLTLQKESRGSAVDDGDHDYLSVKASRKISALRTESGRWPDRGMNAS